LRYKLDDKLSLKTTLLIRNGLVVTPEAILEADVLIQGERIAALGHDLPATEDILTLDAGGCYVLPGLIDSHTHIRLDTGVYRTPDNWLTGTRAAACGGITTVVDFATWLTGWSLRETIEGRLLEAQDAAIDYALHIMVTGLPAGQEKELETLLDLGTPSIKLYTTYRPNYYADDATILRLMRACADFGIIALVHCENDALVTAQTEALLAAGQRGWRYHGRARPALAEQEAIHRILFLAEASGCPVHICHCSTARSVALVAQARGGGLPVSCETCPQYLLLDNTVYDGPEPWRYILQPPLRAPGEPGQLWAMVEAGLVDMLVTDHCDYTAAQKQACDDFTRTPGGLPGVQTLLPLMFTYGVAQGRLTLPRLVEMLSTNPARIWGLWPRKGALWPGFDADVVIYDPRPEGTVTAQSLHHLAGYTPYEGMCIQGRVRTVIARGRIIVQEGEFIGQSGLGRFVRREARPRAPASDPVPFDHGDQTPVKRNGNDNHLGA